MRSVDPAVIAVMAGWLAATMAFAGENDVRATVDAPANLTITQPGDHTDAQARPKQLIVSVAGFEPSPNGPVQAVVTIRCGAETQEIGRFGIFPHVAFSAGQSSPVQRFGFDLPEDSACGRPTSVMIHLEPSVGDGRGASMLIGSATYR